MRDVVQTSLLGTLGLWGHAELCSGGDTADEHVSALHGLACGKSKFFFLRYEKKIKKKNVKEKTLSAGKTVEKQIC